MVIAYHVSRALVCQPTYICIKKHTNTTKLAYIKHWVQLQHGIRFVM